LHFYSDQCAPCAKLEQNVFSQRQVADVVAQSYVPVKIHTSRNLQLTNKYRINHWPVDVIVTPSGLEVFRTDCPQKPADYIAVLKQAAEQAGISAPRQWNKTAPTAGNVGGPFAATSGVATVAAQEAINETQQAAQNVGNNLQAAAGQAQQTFAGAY